MPRQSKENDRLRALRQVGEKAKAWRPPTEVLTKVRAHPTIFPLIDKATGVGGWPIERIAVAHGPSNHGKTLLAHGLGLSFLRADNFYRFIDAEYTTPIEWLQQLMAQYTEHPGFQALRPRSYEQTVDAVRAFIDSVSEAKAKGHLPEDTSGLIVVDSIRKLVPEKLLAKVLGGRDGMDGASGRGAMIKAALNAQWLDELVPSLYHSGLAMVFISREYEKAPDPKEITDPSLGWDYKVAGGKALTFESSLVCRVTRGWTKANDEVVGERHKVTITKTKIAGKEDKTSVGYFHTSNGKACKIGFDRARDVLELALEVGVLEQRGAWTHWTKTGSKWNGIRLAHEALSNDEALLDTLEGESRGTIK